MNQRSPHSLINTVIMTIVVAGILLLASSCSKNESSSVLLASITQTTLQDKPAFIMIHLEAGYKACREPIDLPDAVSPDVCTTGWQEYFWPTVIELIEKADNYGYKLTLAMNPQWGEYIVKDGAHLDLVKQWKAEGHEIAFHHHQISHPDWDGYSNTYSVGTNTDDDELYLGVVNDGFSQVASLVSPDSVISSAIGGLPQEYPSLMNSPWVVFGTGNQFDSYSELGTESSLKPTLTHTADRDYVNLTTRQLSTGMQIPLPDAMFELEKQYSNMNSDEVFGIVWHEYDYYQAKDSYIQWFEFIKQKGNSVRTMSQISGEYFK